MDRIEVKWSKEADRALTEKATRTRVLWPANRGTLNEGRNQVKRERRAEQRTARKLDVVIAAGLDKKAPKQKRPL